MNSHNEKVSILLERNYQLTERVTLLLSELEMVQARINEQRQELYAEREMLRNQRLQLDILYRDE